jgi:serine/threonine protein kinase
LGPTGTVFVPVDAEDWTATISLREIAELLTLELNEKDSLTIVCDCCHAAAFEIDDRLTRTDIRKAMAEDVDRPNIVCLLACTPGAVARESSRYGHGVFTFHLVNALCGAAAHSDGSVTAEGVHSYIARQMNLSSHQRPVFQGRVTGFVPILRQDVSAQSRAKVIADITDGATKLRTLVDDVETRLAELKPPFQTRQEYREAGWQQAAKLVAPVAEKRSSLLLKWGDEVNRVTSWPILSSDVDAMLLEISNITVGTHTEFGEIVGKLGEGGFGTVFEVRAADGSRTAFKVFHGHELTNRAKLERFRIGYRAMDQLVHPRIVKVKRFVECPLGFYMEFVDGQNLRRWLGTEQDPEELLRIYLSIVETVEYANGLGVRHRDIKPENVIMHWDASTAQWEPKITDFDLAWFPAATSHTIEAFGAPFYAAPEQLASPGEDVAHAEQVDIYAVAMLGLYLFEGFDPVHPEVALRALKERLQGWPSASAAQEFVRIIGTAGERDPQMRFTSVSELRKALIEVRERMIATSNPNVAIGLNEFFSNICTVLGKPLRLITPERLRITSASERTTAVVEVVGGSVTVHVTMVDKFLANKTSVSDARKALNRRVTSRIGRASENSLGVRITRHDESQGSALAASGLVFHALPQTASGAALVAEILADIVAIFEQF